MIDSLRYVKSLEAAGIPRVQAEAQVEVMTDVYSKNLATKQDMTELRLEFVELRSELKSELKSIQDKIFIRLSVFTAGWVMAVAAFFKYLA